MQSLNKLKKIIEDINHLDSSFNTKQKDVETVIKEARENYLSTLDNVEVPLYNK